MSDYYGKVEKIIKNYSLEYKFQRGMNWLATLILVSGVFLSLFFYIDKKLVKGFSVIVVILTNLLFYNNKIFREVRDNDPIIVPVYFMLLLFNVFIISFSAKHYAIGSVSLEFLIFSVMTLFEQSKEYEGDFENRLINRYSLCDKINEISDIDLDKFIEKMINELDSQMNLESQYMGSLQGNFFKFIFWILILPIITMVSKYIDIYIFQRDNLDSLVSKLSQVFGALNYFEILFMIGVLLFGIFFVAYAVLRFYNELRYFPSFGRRGQLQIIRR